MLCDLKLQKPAGAVYRLHKFSFLWVFLRSPYDLFLQSQKTYELMVGVIAIMDYKAASWVARLFKDGGIVVPMVVVCYHDAYQVPAQSPKA